MWARLLNIVLGIWLVFAPLVLGYDAPAARSNDIIVVLFLSMFALTAIGASRTRYLNAVLGLWLIVAPFFLGYGSEVAPVLNNILVGVATFCLSLVPLHRRERVAALRRVPTEA